MGYRGRDGWFRRNTGSVPFPVLKGGAMNRFDEVISRQQVQRVVPRNPWWSKALVVFTGIVLAWVLVLLIIGGVFYWLDMLAEWVA